MIITYLATHLESDLMNKYFIHSTGKISYMAKKHNYNRKAPECLNSLSDLQQNYDIYLFSC